MDDPAPQLRTILPKCEWLGTYWLPISHSIFADEVVMVVTKAVGGGPFQNYYVGAVRRGTMGMHTSHSCDTLEEAMAEYMRLVAERTQ